MNDNETQALFLADFARRLGYTSLQEWLIKAADEFAAIARDWRLLRTVIQ